jgi:TPR repeat protein
MPKYLRFIAHRFTDADERPDYEMCAAERAAPHTWHLGWMYEHYATPLRSDGVAKVNIFFTATDLHRDPSEVLGIAWVYERFDAAHFLALPAPSQQRYFLDRFHDAMLRCAKHFRWDPKPLQHAHRRIIGEDFRFSFFWKKPLASRDRRAKVQAFVDASFPAHLWLIFFDAQMRELRRTLLSVGTNGPGAVEFALGEIRWVDCDTVRVQHKNGRDYWLCRMDGRVDFHYPRADAGDPHAEFDLGRMYYDGRCVLQDRERALKLIESAAAKGYKHAIKFLKGIGESSGG